MTFVKHGFAIAIGTALIASSGSVSAADAVIATCSKLINGSEYSFQILMTAEGAAYQRIYQNGIEVSLESRIAKTVISPLQLKKSTALDEKLAGQLALARRVDAQPKKSSAVLERNGLSTSKELKTAIGEGQSSVSTVLIGAILRRLVVSIDA